MMDRPPTFRVENEYDPDAVPQYFQVCVNVLEARKLVWSKPEQMTSCVIVRVGDRRRRTAVRKNMEKPYYREYFVFEMFSCSRDLQRTSVTLSVMEPRCCAPTRLLGQACVDLSAVWSQPHHQIFHKWAQLTLPRDPSAGPRGFLKVDISILFRGEVQYIPPAVKDDIVEDNLLPPSGSEQQKANYLITIHKAYSLPVGNQCASDGSKSRLAKPPSTFVRVTFCGLVIKTSVQPRSFNPAYNEQISITEMFPNVNQHIRLEVCSLENYCSKVLCLTHLRLDQISHGGENGFVPTFGPSLIHMYGDVSSAQGCASESGPYYRGALLLSLRTIVPYFQQGLRSVNVEPTTPIEEDSLWAPEDFYFFCGLLEVSMIDRRLAGKTSGVALTMGDIPLERKTDDDAHILADEIKTKKAYYTGQLKTMKDNGVYGYLDLDHTFPVLQLLTRYPDFRERMYRNNMVHRTVADIEMAIADVERRLMTYDYESLEQMDDELERAMDDTAGGIQKFLDIIGSSHSRSRGEDTLQKYTTELDEKQFLHQKTEMLKIQSGIRHRSKQRSPPKMSVSNLRAKSSSSIPRSELDVTRKLLKRKLADAKTLLQKLSKLMFKSSEGWPDIVIWLVSGSTRMAYAKIPAADVIYSLVNEQCGKKCTKFQTIYLKPIKCPKHLTAVATGCVCIAAKIEVNCWFGLYRQRAAVSSLLPKSYEVNVSGAGEIATYVTANAMYMECRAFLYRAKLSGGADSNGLADPFVRVNIFNQSKDTQIKYKCLTPVWNQIVRIQSLVYSSHERFESNPPIVLIEVYDSDTKGKTEIMGRVQIQPCTDRSRDYAHAPRLQWFELFKGPLYSGQILMSVQLIQINDITQDNVDAIEPLPQSLMPESTTYKIDVYWWGLRDVSSKRKPCAVLEIDDLAIKSDIISDNKANCNFPNGRYTQIFEAPLKEAYCPPLSIRLYDSGTFGRTVFLGTNVLKNPNKFLVDWIPKFQRDASLHSASFSMFKKSPFVSKPSSTQSVTSSTSRSENTITKPDKPLLSSKLTRWFSKKPTVAMMTSVRKNDYTLLPIVKKKEMMKVVREKDWWMRFTCSLKDCGSDEMRPNDKIVVYNSELECQEEFCKFKDWCHTLKLYNGKKTGVPEKDEQLYCGYLKAGIAIYKWPPPDNMVAVTSNGVELDRGYFNDHPNNEPGKYLARVYVVKGYNLMAKDFSGKSDPYVVVRCGKKQMGQRRHYVAKNINPIFGRMFEFRPQLPDDYSLSVSVYDYDTCSSDDLIGTTFIDIEDRVYTKHRATCGLASEYCTSGYNKWRDCFKPSAILEQLCHKNHLPEPIFPDSKSVMVNGIEYRDHARGDFTSDAEKKENICLNLLKKWHTLPLCGYHLVPEHVETRTLINPDKPGLDQGKLQLWVDIFPLDSGLVIPPPIDITPRKPDEYELRVTVWDVVGITLDDYDFITGDNASDLYVKAWIGDPEKAQATDIHYRSLTGEGNFNWRMVFRFHYQHTERRLIFQDTNMFAEGKEEHVPPLLQVNVMDNDTISSDDFLGSLTLNLNSMPRGAKTPRYCTLSAISKTPRLNLFNTRSVRGWWPLRTLDSITGKNLPAGKIDLELHLLSKDKAVLMPVGVGREGPQPLHPPKRPETSYNVFMSPLTSLRQFMHRRGWLSIAVLVLLALVLMCLLSAYLALPRILLEKLLG